MLQFDRISLDDKTQSLRAEVREFLDDTHEHFPLPLSDFTTGHDASFSRKLGDKGWIGMCWPKQYGGSDASFFERYVVTEELLAAGAPVSAHWIADRQSGPLLLRYGTEEQKQTYLPKIANGEAFFSIGMSEPDRDRIWPRFVRRQSKKAISTELMAPKYGRLTRTGTTILSVWCALKPSQRIAMPGCHK